MQQDKMMEHGFKESIKYVIDNSSNFTEKMKRDMKGIVDAGRSPEEISMGLLTYLAAMRVYY